MKTRDETRETAPDDEMLAGYDFSGREGVRGKYYQRYRQGYTVRVRHEDGSISVRHENLPEGAPAWIEEAERRYRECKEGRVEGIPAEQVLEDIRQKLTPRRRL